MYSNYQIEIETLICECLDKISKCEEPDNTEQEQVIGLLVRGNTTINAEQLNQVKVFNGYLIKLALSKEYSIVRTDDDDPLEIGTIEENGQDDHYVHQAYNPNSDPMNIMDEGS